MTRLRYYMNMLAVMVLVALFASNAKAATVWTQSDGYYHWYKSGTANKYAITTDIEVSTSWVKQNGTYIQCKSSGGATKYWQQGYDCTGKQLAAPPPTCMAFVCNDDFGWTFDMSKNTVLACPMIKIDKGIAMIYDGKQAGVEKCR